MAVRSVYDLDIPELAGATLITEGLSAVRPSANREQWLVKMPFGFMLTRYEDITAVLRDGRFHSAVHLMPGSSAQDILPEDTTISILQAEGAEHTRLRRLVLPAFLKGSVDKYRPFMAQLVTELVDKVAAAGRCEFGKDICYPFPVQVICELLGAPKEDWPLFSQWVDDIARRFDNDVANDLEDIKRGTKGLNNYVLAMIEDRRTRPADDLISHLIAIEEQGDRLSTKELVKMLEVLLFAGTDTTRNQLGCCVATLLQHDQWSVLVERPELMIQAVEECLRFMGTIRGTVRIASEDIEYRGVLFPKGTFLMPAFTSGNRDAEIWDEPEVFDITKERGMRSSMTFGSGVHTCLGSQLARAELQEALSVLTRRWPNLALDGPIEWKPVNEGIWGPAKLPLRF